MKKVIVVCIAIMAMFVLVGCGSKQADQSQMIDTSTLEQSMPQDPGTNEATTQDANASTNVDSGDQTTGIGDSNTTPKSETKKSGIRPEFKKSMDKYQAFFDKYVDFMKKYNKSSNPAKMAKDYAEIMQKYADTMSAWEAVDQSELSTEEAAYYAKVSAHIQAKLLEVY